MRHLMPGAVGRSLADLDIAGNGPHVRRAEFPEAEGSIDGTASHTRGSPSMPPSLIDDAADALITRLSRPLDVANRDAFRAAAQDALARVRCLGEGAAYRARTTGRGVAC